MWALVVATAVVVVIISVIFSVTVVVWVGASVTVTALVVVDIAVVAIAAEDVSAGGISAFFTSAHEVTAENRSTASAADTILFFILYTFLFCKVKAENYSEIFFFCRNFKGSALKFCKAFGY